MSRPKLPEGEKLVPLTVRVSPDIFNRLQILSASNSAYTVADFCRYAIEKILPKLEAKYLPQTEEDIRDDRENSYDYE